MSPARQHPALTLEQEPLLVVRSLATNFSSGYLIEEHTHTWRQLLYASAGAMTVYAGQWTWMDPSGPGRFHSGRAAALHPYVGRGGHAIAVFSGGTR
jgi:hypothetical protein